MRIKMIVSDLDGTLFNSDEAGYEISSRLISEINTFKKNGRIFTIATGRPEETSLDIIQKLGVNGPYIVHNGAKIVDEGGKAIYSDTFKLNDWLPFLEKLQQAGASVIFSYNKQVLCLNYTQRVAVYERKELINCQVAERDLLNLELAVHKILIIGDVEKYKKYWDQLDDFFQSEFRYFISEDDYMEIVKKDVSKGAALRQLKIYLGIKDEEVITIGNHMNDKELIEEAYIGVAVANAAEGLKSIADFITVGEYEEGVIEVINKFA